MKRASARSLALAGLAGGLLAGVVCAQTSIKTDSSWGRTPAALSGSPSATPVVGNRGATYRVSGNVYTIAEALDRLKGTNLFHSFESFSVGAGDAAVFTTATPTINNVVSRVSGSTATQINGLLALKPENGGAPNFFFINPAGVTFGAGALVDVPAAFHISTANRLSFADGTMFKAGDGSDSSLTVAAPEAFGFLGTTRSSLYVMEGATLSPAAGHELSAFAGDVRIDAGQLATAGGGAIRIAAVGQDQLDVPLAGPLPSAHGNLDVVNGGNVVARSVPLENGAGISVSAGDVLIDGHASGATFTGIATVPSQDGAASAGSIHLAAAGYLRVFDGGVIESQSYGDGSPGEIVVRAQNLTLDSRGNWDAVDSQGVPVPTGIVTCGCAPGGLASAGNVTVIVAEDARILNGAGVVSLTLGAGSAGSIDMDTRDLLIDGQQSYYADVISAAIYGATGDAGDITLEIRGNLSMRDGAEVLTQAEAGSGAGGAISITVANEASLVNGAWIATLAPGTADAGSISVEVHNLSIDGQARSFAGIMSLAWGTAGNTGSVAVQVDDGLALLRGAQISTVGYDTGDANAVEVRARGNLSIHTGAQISSFNWHAGDAGRVTVSANSILIDGATLPTGLFSRVMTGPGDAGGIGVHANEALSLLEGGEISSWSFEAATAAGTIDITAGSLHLDGMGSYTPIKTTAGYYSSNDAGDVSVDVEGTLTIRGIAEISSNTFGAGAAGNVSVHAREIIIEGDAGRETGIGAGANTFASARARAGNVTVIADEGISLDRFGYISVINQALVDDPAAGAGSVRVIAPRISLTNDSRISAETTGNSIGSTIVLLGAPDGSGSLDISGDGTSRIAASTRLLTPFELMVNGLGAQLPGAGSGDAGDVVIRASGLSVSGVSIVSLAGEGTSGRAGRVDIAATYDVSVLANSRVATDTFGLGPAGDVRVRGAGVLADRSEISAAARGGSGGQPGNVTIDATRSVTLSNGGQISIRNDATVANPGALSRTQLSVSAASIQLIDARITAESTGNVAASDIRIRFDDRLYLDPSAITTSATDGNGGSIRIEGSGTVILDRSQITTSVSGPSGDGGDIVIRAGTLVMETGFIQANTAGTGGRGGNVTIDVRTLLASGGTLLVGGSTPAVFDPNAFGLNVIQAAAPDGVSGLIGIAAPVLDIAGELSGLEAEVLDLGPLGRDLCRVGAGSSLTPVGRGGLRPSAAGLMRPEYAGQATAAQGARAPRALQEPIVASAGYGCW